MFDFIYGLIWNAFIGVFTLLLLAFVLCCLDSLKDWLWMKWEFYIEDRCRDIARNVVDEYENRRGMK